MCLREKMLDAEVKIYLKMSACHKTDFSDSVPWISYVLCVFPLNLMCERQGPFVLTESLHDLHQAKRFRG